MIPAVCDNYLQGGILPVSYTHLDVYKRQVLIPLPVPASVYGLVIMLIALGTHIILSLIHIFSVQ